MPMPTPPIVVHLILDEFIGIEGIPREIPNGTAVRRSLRSFFHSNGFEIFGRAYSRFDETANSIPNLLNHESVAVDEFFTEGEPKRLRNNFYFNNMYEAGYKIHVYQPNYFDFCEGYQHQIASCRTFSNFGISPVKTLPLPEIVKAELILRNFAELSAVWRKFLAYYEDLRRRAVRNGYHLPAWMHGSPHVWSAGGFQVLDLVARDVANAAPGDLYFAHLVVPHAPYLYDRSCDLRNPDDWENRPESNTSHSRIHLYGLYLEQVECLQTRLQGIFDSWRRAGVYDRAKVIIHGDHGSRLYLTEPTIANKDQLLDADYIDSFSTLFAVKAPEPEPRYDRRMVAIQDALAAVTANRSLDELAGRAETPYVFLRNLRGSAMMRQPLPNFGDVPVE
jgi:hypothetical protein